MKKALITGIAGFVGSHLTEYLISQKIGIFGLIHPNHPTSNLDSLKDKIKLIKCDILNKKSVENNIDKNDFDYVFHLAAFSSPAESFKDPRSTLQNNIIGQLILLESLVKSRSKAKILIVGSADEYGNVKLKDLPINEDQPLAPISPYAVSKVAQDLLGYQFYLHYKLNTIRVRPFNHIGPKQSKAFVVPTFASQIAKLEKKGKGELKVGNLNTYRDFTDVRDIVRAYLLACEKGKTGDVYNIGSGKVYKIADVLDKLISLSSVEINVIKDKKLVHVADIVKICCDYSKFKKQTGWQPKIPITKSLSDTIKYERQQLE